MEIAIESGNKEKFLAAVEDARNLDELGTDEMTPLMWAARKGNLSFVQILLEAGASPSFTGRNGWNARDIALIYGEHGMLKQTKESLDISNMLKENGVEISNT